MTDKNDDIIAEESSWSLAAQLEEDHWNVRSSADKIHYLQNIGNTFPYPEPPELQTLRTDLVVTSEDEKKLHSKIENLDSAIDAAKIEAFQAKQKIEEEKFKHSLAEEDADIDPNYSQILQIAENDKKAAEEKCVELELEAVNAKLEFNALGERKVNLIQQLEGYHVDNNLLNRIQEYEEIVAPLNQENLVSLIEEIQSSDSNSVTQETYNKLNNFLNNNAGITVQLDTTRVDAEADKIPHAVARDLYSWGGAGYSGRIKGALGADALILPIDKAWDEIYAMDDGNYWETNSYNFWSHGNQRFIYPVPIDRAGWEYEIPPNPLVASIWKGAYASVPGATAGAIVGSVVPVLGTAVGFFVGGIGAGLAEGVPSMAIDNAKLENLKQDVEQVRPIRENQQVTHEANSALNQAANGDISLESVVDAFKKVDLSSTEPFLQQNLEGLFKGETVYTEINGETIEGSYIEVLNTIEQNYYTNEITLTTHPIGQFDGGIAVELQRNLDAPSKGFVPTEVIGLEKPLTQIETEAAFNHLDSVKQDSREINELRGSWIFTENNALSITDAQNISTTVGMPTTASTETAFYVKRDQIFTQQEIEPGQSIELRKEIKQAFTEIESLQPEVSLNMELQSLKQVGLGKYQIGLSEFQATYSNGEMTQTLILQGSPSEEAQDTDYNFEFGGLAIHSMQKTITDKNGKQLYHFNWKDSGKYLRPKDNLANYSTVNTESGTKEVYKPAKNVPRFSIDITPGFEVTDALGIDSFEQTALNIMPDYEKQKYTTQYLKDMNVLEKPFWESYNAEATSLESPSAESNNKVPAAFILPFMREAFANEMPVPKSSDLQDEKLQQLDLDWIKQPLAGLHNNVENALQQGSQQINGLLTDNDAVEIATKSAQWVADVASEAVVNANAMFLNALPWDHADSDINDSDPDPLDTKATTKKLNSFDSGAQEQDDNIAGSVNKIQLAQPKLPFNYDDLLGIVDKPNVIHETATVTRYSENGWALKSEAAINSGNDNQLYFQRNGYVAPNGLDTYYFTHSPPDAVPYRFATQSDSEGKIFYGEHFAVIDIIPDVLQEASQDVASIVHTRNTELYEPFLYDSTQRGNAQLAKVTSATFANITEAQFDGLKKGLEISDFVKQLDLSTDRIETVQWDDIKEEGLPLNLRTADIHTPTSSTLLEYSNTDLLSPSESFEYAVSIERDEIDGKEKLVASSTQKDENNNEVESKFYIDNVTDETIDAIKSSEIKLYDLTGFEYPLFSEFESFTDTLGFIDKKNTLQAALDFLPGHKIDVDALEQIGDPAEQEPVGWGESTNSNKSNSNTEEKQEPESKNIFPSLSELATNAGALFVKALTSPPPPP